MNKFVILILGINLLNPTEARFPNFKRKPFTHKPVNDLGDPLILTPYLENNQIVEARSAAQVNLKAFQGVSSYSGFFTVDKSTNSNLFFWFFPSASDFKNDPVLLWLQGGPGSSSLYGLFTENGPFVVDENLNVSLREFSWHRNHSVIYIDQPVGTGFSFTDGDYLETEEEVGEHLYRALLQFFILFPEIKNNEFFIAGESYAGKYVPAISYTILQKNKDSEEEINLKGLLIGNGLSDPVNQLGYGTLLYQLGLIDLSQLDSINKIQSEAVESINKEDYEMATFSINEIMEFFVYFTDLNNVYNYLEDDINATENFQSFIVQDDVRLAINVGNQLYDTESYGVYYALYADISKSVAPWIIELLNNYRVAIYNGQLDIIVGYVLTENYLQNLEFSGAEEYKTASRGVWRVNEKVAGYAKVAGNLTEVLVRNAGHFVPGDQPEHAYNLVYNFIRNIPLA